MLLWEEVPARLKGDDDLLWRLFYRRCGAIKREFSYVCFCGCLMHGLAQDDAQLPAT